METTGSFRLDHYLLYAFIGLCLSKPCPAIKPVKLRIVKFCFNYFSQPFQADCTWLFTGLAVAQPSYKMGLVFPSGTNRTLVCSAQAKDVRLCEE